VAFLVLENRDPHDVQFLAIDDNVRKMAESKPSECGGTLVKRKLPRPGLNRRQTVPHFSLEPICQVPAAFRGIIIDRRVEVLLNGPDGTPASSARAPHPCPELLFAQRLHSAAFKLRISTECLGNYLVRFVSGWRQGKAPQECVSKVQPIALRQTEDSSFNLLQGAHGSKTTARQTTGKVRHDFDSGACQLPTAIGRRRALEEPAALDLFCSH
jgi:hypothetical protein